MTTRTSISDFLTLQEQRAREYHRLHEAFKEMLETKEETSFKELVMELTQQFAAISKAVVVIEQRLKEGGDEHGLVAAQHIRSVQVFERQKLQSTVQIQTLRKAQAFEELDWQQSTDEDTLHFPSIHRAEKTYFTELQRSTKELASAVEVINDALYEIRCLL